MDGLGRGGDAVVDRICAAFGLGPPTYMREGAPTSTNTTWKVEAGGSSFLVKQFQYPPDDETWLRTIGEAAEFEWHVHLSEIVPMPVPVRSTLGHLVEVVDHPDGRSVLTRVHRWCEGIPADRYRQVSLAGAGALLAAVQQCGGDYQTSSEGSLRWWRWDPLRWLEALRVEGYLDRSEAAMGRGALVEAERLLALAKERASHWRMCHFDHKPANVLVHDGAMTLVDWDEAAMCPPGMEAAEAAILWASTPEGVDRGRLESFLDGYRSAGGALRPVSIDDLAKWLASKVGWFDYTAQRSLGALPGSPADVTESITAARDTLGELSAGMGQLERWVRWMT